MEINKGDKFVAKNNMFFMNKGETAVVVETNKYGVLFDYGKNCIFVDIDTFKENFEKVVEKKPVEKKINSVTAEHVQYIMDNAEYEIFTTFDKCTVVSCKLPNGFVIVESSACVDAENYDEELGAEICFGKIVDKVWEMEGYKLQNEMHEYAVKKAKTESNKKIEQKRELDEEFKKVEKLLASLIYPSAKTKTENKCCIFSTVRVNHTVSACFIKYPFKGFM